MDSSVCVRLFKESSMHRPARKYIRATMLKSQSGEQFPVKLRPDEESTTDPEAIQIETHGHVLKQIVVPFIIAGLGMVVAGMFLDRAQAWDVFVNVSEIMILVPSLLGLKGNLEMTLASRLSTSANLGKMDDPKEQVSMICGNLSLVQLQSIVVGLLSSIVAVCSSALFKYDLNISHSLLLASCSIVTASSASLILGAITSMVIIASRRYSVNPDNIATPIAGSLGDITSLVLLSLIATAVYNSGDNMAAISVLIIVLFLGIMPLWYFISKRNEHTKTVLFTGWKPIIFSMMISTVGGLILDKMVQKYSGIAVFQPVINGVGGNLVSIQASRLATALHQREGTDTPGYLPPGYSILPSPYQVFLSEHRHAVTARVLLFLVLPGQMFFSLVICFLKTSHIWLNVPFLILYIIAALIQVILLLYLATVLTNYCWSKECDPDNTTIPYLTALGDLFGIILLAAVFQILNMIGMPFKLAA
ncbi:solute carrier family 41 member 1 isoform X3 [Nilaparvata lugens]|uniref:solute carrier family 41 member 1 isoform X3 n=1 Tax=Nilaparvata lugens TaxID=108931 RepID=UPI00193D3603|nr:solute carrier family 41 member 1 isoform X3 [Nilaparvata lugens]